MSRSDSTNWREKRSIADPSNRMYNRFQQLAPSRKHEKAEKHKKDQSIKRDKTAPNLQNLAQIEKTEKLEKTEKPLIQPAGVLPIRTEYTKDKISYGVACCRLNGDKPEILLICKRYTYAYNLFVHGKYNSGNANEIISLFNGMTVDEKLDILSLNFAQIWYRIWLNSVTKTQNYFMAKNKFESTFAVDAGEKLKKLIAKSHTNADRIWEIPKGRKKYKTESDIHTAVREFYEETGVPKKSYKLFNATRTYSYIDDNVRYTNIYYIAFTKHVALPRVNFDMQDQVDEISDIRWMDIEAIRFVDPSKRLENFVKPVFNYIKKNI